jgi:hypothetical protein
VVGAVSIYPPESSRDFSNTLILRDYRRSGLAEEGCGNAGESEEEEEQEFGSGPVGSGKAEEVLCREMPFVFN